MRVREIKLCAFALVTTLLLAVTPARALSILPGSTTNVVAGETYSYTANLGSKVSIDDTFSFVAPPPGLGAITTSIAFNVGGSTQPGDFGVSDLTLKWTDSLLNPIATLLVTNALGVVSNPSASLLIALAPGSPYHLFVTGTALGGGGIYNINVTATPLPPALILFGTALAGLTWLGRRRRRTNAAL